ncbi:MAG: hypothetical protein R2784_16725 [Saprospiraceae bacterium]
MKNLLLTVFMTALSLYAYSQAALEISLINETNEPVIGQVVMVKNSGNQLRKTSCF